MEQTLKKEKINTMKIIGKSIKLCLGSSKKHIIYHCSTSLFSSLSFTLNTVVMGLFFSALYDFASGKVSFKKLLLSILIYGIVNIINRTFNMYDNISAEIMKRYIERDLSEKANIKANKIGVVSYEIPKNLDNIKKAKDGINACYRIFKTVLDVIFFILHTLFL